MENYVICILKINVLAALGIILTLAIAAFSQERYSVKWKYIMWLIIGLFLMFPIHITNGNGLVRIEFRKGIDRRADAAVGESFIEDDGSSFYNSEESLNRSGRAERITIIKQYAGCNVSNILKIILCVWLSGTVLFIIRNCVRYSIAMSELTRWGVPVRNEEIIFLYQRICAEQHVKKPPKIMIGTKVNSPILTGIVHSRLYLPDETFTEEELELLFHHELSHYKRNDLWYKMFLLIVNTVYWFNPFLYLMRREADKDIEYLCDSRVLVKRSASECALYNRLLLRTASGNKHNLYISAGLNDNTAAFKKRILYIRKANQLRQGMIPATFCATVLVVLNLLMGVSASVEAESEVQGNQEMTRIYLYDDNRRERWGDYDMMKIYSIDPDNYFEIWGNGEITHRPYQHSRTFAK